VQTALVILDKVDSQVRSIELSLKYVAWKVWGIGMFWHAPMGTVSVKTKSSRQSPGGPQVGPLLKKVALTRGVPWRASIGVAPTDTAVARIAAMVMSCMVYEAM
jgi:hypothetical protein